MYFEKNLEYLKEKQEDLSNQLDQYDLSSFNQIEEIHSVITKDNEKAIVINNNGLEYRLNSLYRPREEAKRWVEQYKFQNINNVISMFGLGNGMFTSEIVKKMGENDILFIYEPCVDLFLHALKEYDLKDIIIAKNVFIYIEGINEYEFHMHLQGVTNITNFKTQIVCVHPQYDKIFANSCIKFYKDIKDNLNHTMINVNTEIYFGEKIISNLFNNMRYLKNSNTLLELKNEFPDDITAIVVAAGPSVEENIEELKKAKGKAVIFAVDRILDYLLDSGLEPDFTLTIDPKKPVEYFSKREDVKIPLIAYLEANSDILDSHKGRKIICTQNSFMDEIYNKTGRISPEVIPSGSVALLAFSVCLELGFKNIILVGQDLAYNGEMSHAGGLQSNLDKELDLFVEGVDGKQVRSRYDWKEFLTRYEDLIKMNSQAKVIDAKDKGAKIKGTINMSLKEAVHLYCKQFFDCSDIFLNKETTFNSEEIIFIKEYLENNLSIVKKMKEKAEIAVNICNELLRVNKNSKINKVNDKIEKLGKINHYIERQPLYSIMDAYITSKTSYQLANMYQFSQDETENKINTYKKAKVIYQAVIEATDFVKPNIEKAIEEI